MPEFLRNAFGPGHFLPHGYCYLWDAGLLRLHLFSDLAIGLSYIAISLTLVYLVRRARHDMPFHMMFVAFGAFIIACGATHLMEAWTLWSPVYWLSGSVKFLTAVASVATAVALPPLVPRALDLIRSGKLAEERKRELEASHEALRDQIAERKKAEDEIRRLNQELEARVAQRTKDLLEANRELKRSEGKLRAFLESASQGILAVDAEGRMQLVNAKLEQMFGYKREELIGRPLDLLIPERYRGAHAQYRTAYFNKPKHRPMGLGLDLAGVKKDGTEFPLEISLSYTGEGPDLLALAFITDITDRKRIEEQLRETAKLESLGVLAGGIAHDFNNLLVGIMGNASLAADAIPPDQPRLRGMLDGILKSSERAADLVRQLLAYSGKGRFVVEPVDVSALIRDTVELIQASVPKNVELRLDLAATPPIDADRSQIQQLIMNLVINGAEAIGERPGIVSVRTSRELATGGDGGALVRIVVEDNGCGMDEATRARMFDPFFTTKFTGRGLGLAAVQGIVRGHRGEIDVVSEPGQGTRIAVSFPASNRAVEQAADSAARHPAGGDHAVLVIDDEAVVRSSARMALENSNYRVLVAENGKRGVEVFENYARDISVVVLDLTMPVLGGEETMRRLKAIRPDVRVILSSGYDQIEALRRFDPKELSGFLQKPYTAGRLVEAVRAALESKFAGA